MKKKIERKEESEIDKKYINKEREKEGGREACLSNQSEQINSMNEDLMTDKYQTLSTLFHLLQLLWYDIINIVIAYNIYKLCNINL